MQRERVTFGLRDQITKQTIQHRFGGGPVLRGSAPVCRIQVVRRQFQRCGRFQAVPRPDAGQHQAMERSQLPLTRGQPDSVRHGLQECVTALLAVLPRHARAVQHRAEQLRERFQFRCSFVGRAEARDQLSAQRRPMQQSKARAIEDFAAAIEVIVQPGQFRQCCFKLFLCHTVYFPELSSYGFGNSLLAGLGIVTGLRCNRDHCANRAEPGPDVLKDRDQFRVRQFGIRHIGSPLRLPDRIAPKRVG